jgi:hypothetical protein
VNAFVEGILTYNNPFATPIPAIFNYVIGPASGFNAALTYISFYIDGVQHINEHQPSVDGAFSYPFDILVGSHTYTTHAQMQLQSTGPCPLCWDPQPVVNGSASYSGTFTYPNV